MLTRERILSHLALAEQNGQIYETQNNLQALQRLQLAVLEYWKAYQGKDGDVSTAEVLSRCSAVLCNLMRRLSHVLDHQAQEKGV